MNARGDNLSLEHVYQQNIMPVRSVAYGVLKNESDAEDVANDIFKGTERRKTVSEKLSERKIMERASRLDLNPSEELLTRIEKEAAQHPGAFLKVLDFERKVVFLRKRLFVTFCAVLLLTLLGAGVAGNYGIAPSVKHADAFGETADGSSGDSKTDTVEDITRAPVFINRLNSTFTEFTLAYGTDLDYKMNCYGYALQMYCPDGSSSDLYLQQPGEFANDQETFWTLYNEYIYLCSFGNAQSYTAFVIDKMYSDFSALNSSSGNEWTIEETTATATVPSGYRKIALAIGYNDYRKDFHYYLRHSDGTWSHKRGSTSLSCMSISSGVALTDSNIATTATEGWYTEGLKFFLVKKSAVIDYPHEYGHYVNTLKTNPVFKDKAGCKNSKSRTITGTSTSSLLDYPRDVDFFAFTPSTTASYTFTTSLSESTYNIDIYVYNTSGTLIASDTSLSNASLTVNLTAGQRYFIKVYDVNHNVTDYTFYH